MALFDHDDGVAEKRNLPGDGGKEVSQSEAASDTVLTLTPHSQRSTYATPMQFGANSAASIATCGQGVWQVRTGRALPTSWT